jgi:hypothetical protein
VTKQSSDWVLAEVRLPTEQEAGGFGAVEVIVQCNPSHKPEEPWQGLRIAKPVFIGRNRERILWVDVKSSEPIENAAWFVSHWRPFPKFPKAVVSK